MFAPMEGITSPPVRHLFAERGGIDIVCTEFVRVTAQPLSPKLLAKHVAQTPRAKLSVQVMGNDLAQMADAAALVTKAGADVVDINLGCPAPKAVRKGVGSAMLKSPALCERVVRAMREQTHLPLSAKMRAGFDDSAQVLEIATALVDAGVDFLTIHPRRRADFYGGVADWRIIRLLAKNLPVPVIGNGDIWYADDALRIRVETGCAGVMLGRGALRNPFIFRQIDALEEGLPLPEFGGQAVLEHIIALSDLFRGTLPGSALTGLLKEQVRFLGRAVRDGGVFTRAALQSEGWSQLLKVAEDHLLELGPGDLDLGQGGHRLERSGSALSGGHPAVEEACALGALSAV